MRPGMANLIRKFFDRLLAVNAFVTVVAKRNAVVYLTPEQPRSPVHIAGVMHFQPPCGVAGSALIAVKLAAQRAH